MRLVLSTALLVSSALLAPQVQAGSSTEALASCFASALTADDEQLAVRWIYAGISSHAQVKELSGVTAAQREHLDQDLAELFARLIADDCPQQASVAVRADGVNSFREAFAIVSRQAVTNLLAGDEVKEAFSNFSEYVDKGRIKSALD